MLQEARIAIIARPVAFCTVRRARELHYAARPIAADRLEAALLGGARRHALFVSGLRALMVHPAFPKDSAAKRSMRCYAHAKQFNRHRRELRILRTRLGRIIRDIRRKIVGQEHIAAAFETPLARASQIHSQQQRQRGWKLLFLPCSRGRVHRQGQSQRALRVRGESLRRHTNARHRRPVRAEHQVLAGQPVRRSHPAGRHRGHPKAHCRIERAYVDKGCRGHDA